MKILIWRHFKNVKRSCLEYCQNVCQSVVEWCKAINSFLQRAFSFFIWECIEKRVRYQKVSTRKIEGTPQQTNKQHTILCVAVISRNYNIITYAVVFPFGLPFSAFFVLPLLREHLGHYISILLHPSNAGRQCLRMHRFALNTEPVIIAES